MNKKHFLLNILKYICYIPSLYLAIALFIFLPYYNYQYVKTHTFKEWILLGEIVPTLKALVFPYIEYKKYRQIQKSKTEYQKYLELDKKTRQDIESIGKAMILYQKGLNLFLNKENKETAIYNLKQACDYINSVDFDRLLNNKKVRKDFKQFARAIKFFMKPAINYYYKGLKENNPELLMKADNYVDNYEKALKDKNKK